MLDLLREQEKTSFPSRESSFSGWEQSAVSSTLIATIRVSDNFGNQTNVTSSRSIALQTNLRNGLFVSNNPVHWIDPLGLITIAIPGVGPQRDRGGNSSNEAFIRGVNKAHSDTQVFSRDEIGKAVDAIRNARANGDNCVNIYGYSRGGVGALNLAKALEKAGISVDNLTTIDPVRFPGEPNPLPVPSNVQNASNYYQDGSQMGPTDFPGTPLAPGANVRNNPIPDGNRGGYDVRHENMPSIILGQ